MWIWLWKSQTAHQTEVENLHVKLLNIKEQNKKAIDSQRANIIIFIFKFFWGAGLRNISFFLFFRKRLFMPLHTQRAPLTQRAERSESGKQQPHQQENLEKYPTPFYRLRHWTNKSEVSYYCWGESARRGAIFLPLPRNLEQTKPTEKVIYRDEHDNRREEKNEEENQSFPGCSCRRRFTLLPFGIPRHGNWQFSFCSTALFPTLFPSSAVFGFAGS